MGWKRLICETASTEEWLGNRERELPAGTGSVESRSGGIHPRCRWWRASQDSNYLYAIRDLADRTTPSASAACMRRLSGHADVGGALPRKPFLYPSAAAVHSLFLESLNQLVVREKRLCESDKRRTDRVKILPSFCTTSMKPPHATRKAKSYINVFVAMGYPNRYTGFWFTRFQFVEQVRVFAKNHLEEV